MDTPERMIEIVERLNLAADSVATLDDLPGAFYVDITIRMHRHSGDGYTNRDLVDAADKLAAWLGAIRYKNAEDGYMFESPTTVTSGHTRVQAYLLAPPPPPAPATLPDLDI